MLDVSRREREGKVRGGEEGGTKSRGRQALGGGEGEKPRALHHCWSRVKKGRM